MKIKNSLKLFVVFIVFLVACSPDDDEFDFIPDRDRTEQQATDNGLILDYLNTHYYNSQDLSMLTNAVPSDIEISLLQDGETVPDGHTLLIDSPDLVTRTSENEGTTYEYYILKINQGGGAFSPEFTDRVRTLYEGSLISDSSEVFDSAVTPVDFNLVALPGGLATIAGWSHVFPDFNVASSFTSGSTTEYNDFGLGVMFLPSGLSYYSGTGGGSVPSYANLVFKFALLQAQANDHDQDGIPSYIEDLNNNLNELDDDTDGDTAPNYVDVDDDNDGVFTVNELIPSVITVDTNLGEEEPVLDAGQYELSRSELMGVITINVVTIADANDDGIPDYLDETITTNYNE